MQIIPFPRKTKLTTTSITKTIAALGPRRSKKALLEAARASCLAKGKGDAIFVLIEAHRSAWHQWDQAVPLEDHPAGAAEVDRRADIKWSLLKDVFSTTPTTIEGIIALADYCRELHELCENELDDDPLFDALETISRVLKALSHRFD
jgi:hypothetical protein